jgi:hypothetical protein
MTSMHKLSHLVAEEWQPHSHQAFFRHAVVAGDTHRIEAVVPHGDASVFEALTSCMEPPYLLLYILHTPRGKGAAGRYTSTEMSCDDFRRFIANFKDYLQADGRFDLWSHSPSDGSTVVWDRHNQLYAYGNLPQFSSQLRTLGFAEGEIAPLGAHMHHYRAAFDSDARALLDFCPWHHSELRPEDEQQQTTP